MSVGSAEFLKPSARAKLQDAGLLSVSELLLLLKSSSSYRRVGEQEKDVNGPPNESGSVDAVQKLRLRCPGLTDEEAALVVKGVEDYEAKQKRDVEGQSSSSPESLADRMPTQSSSDTSSPFRTFSIRDLLNGEHKRSRVNDDGGNHDGGESPLASTQNSVDLATPSIPTFSRAFDELLGGRGLPCGELAEVAGPPGVGKTQLLMQLAVSSLLPEEFGGLSVFTPAAAAGQRATLNGACLFVDTEGSFVASRYREIALAAVVHIRELASQSPSATLRNGPTDARITTTAAADAATATSPSTESELNDASRMREAANALSLDYVLANTYILQINTLVDLLSLAHCLPVILGAHGNIGFIAIDSIAFPFRSSTFTHASSTGATSASAPHVVSQYANASACGTQLASGLQVSRMSESAALLSSFTLKPANRSRLLFLCGQQLQKHAREFDVSIAVSNHVTTRRIPMRASDRVRRAYSLAGKRQRSVSVGELAVDKEDDDVDDEDGSDSQSDGEEVDGDANQGLSARNLGFDQTVAVLVPALGDLWACSPSVRILLGNRHQRDCAAQEARRIYSNLQTNPHQNMAQCLYENGQGENDSHHISEDLTLVSVGTGVSQHRVARILKHPFHPRGLECCFVINQRGIRNAEGIAAQFLDM